MPVHEQALQLVSGSGLDQTGLTNSISWASEASPTLGCSIKISRDIYIYVCMSGLSTILYGKPIQKIFMLKCVGEIT